MEQRHAPARQWRGGSARTSHSEAAVSTPRLPARQAEHAIVVFFAVAMGLASMQRATIAILAVPLQAALGLSMPQLGLLQAAVLVGYVAGQVRPVLGGCFLPALQDRLLHRSPLQGCLELRACTRKTPVWPAAGSSTQAEPLLGSAEPPPVAVA